MLRPSKTLCFYFPLSKYWCSLGVIDRFYASWDHFQLSFTHLFVWCFLFENVVSTWGDFLLVCFLVHLLGKILKLNLRQILCFHLHLYKYSLGPWPWEFLGFNLYHSFKQVLFPVHEVLAQSDFHSIKIRLLFSCLYNSIQNLENKQFFFTLIFFAAHSDHDKAVKLG